MQRIVNWTNRFETKKLLIDIQQQITTTIPQLNFFDIFDLNFFKGYFSTVNREPRRAFLSWRVEKQKGKISQKRLYIGR